jgi:hypothetical protein
MNSEECWAVRGEECVDLDLLYIFFLFSTFFYKLFHKICLRFVYGRLQEVTFLSQNIAQFLKEKDRVESQSGVH